MNSKQEIKDFSLETVSYKLADIITNQDPESEKYEKISAIFKFYETEIKSASNCSLVKFSEPMLVYGGDTCLHLAVKNNFMFITKLLINNMVDLNALCWGKNRTALHYAAEEKMIGIFREICRYPEVDVDIVDNHNENVLDICIRKSFIEGIQALVKNRLIAKINPKRVYGLHLSNLIAQINDFKLQQKIKDLIFPHVIINQSDKIDSCNRILEYLNNDFDVNVKNIEGDTLLHCAVKYQRPDIVLLLCNSENLDVNIKDSQGYTALERAVIICMQPELADDHYQILDDFPRKTIFRSNSDNCSNSSLEDQILKIRKLRLASIKAMINSAHFFDIKNCLHLIYLRDGEKKQEILEALSYKSVAKRAVEYQTMFFPQTRSTDSLNLNDELKLLDLAQIKPLALPSEEFLNKEKYSRNKSHIQRIESTENQLHDLLFKLGLSNQIHENDMYDTNKFKRHFNFKKLMEQYEKNESPYEFLKSNQFKKVYTSVGSHKKSKDPLNQLILIFNVCQGQKEKNIYFINIYETYVNTIGLLSLFTPQEILASLIILRPYLNKNQILLSNIVVKNILLLSHAFGYDITKEDFVCIFNIFINNIKFVGVKTILKRIFSETVSVFFNEAEEVLEKRRSDFDFIKKSLEIIKDKSKTDSMENVRLIAWEVCNFTLELYKKCPLSVFDAKSERASEFEYYKKMADNFLNLIAGTVLTQKDLKACARAISFWVAVAKECLHFPYGSDINATGIIISALERFEITRLKKVLHLDEKTSLLIAELKKLMSLENNFRVMREFTKKYPNSFPFFMLMIRENTLFREQVQIKTVSSFGKLYEPIISLKISFHCYHSQLKSNFMQKIETININEEDIARMSWVLKPDISNFSDPECSLFKFEENFKFFVKNCMPLTVICNGKILENQKALDEIKIWLDRMKKESKINSLAAEKMYKECKEYLDKKKDASPYIQRTSKKKTLVPPLQLSHKELHRTHSIYQISPKRRTKSLTVEEESDSSLLSSSSSNR